MITPINGHLVIEPIKTSAYIPNGETYEEIGVIIEVDKGILQTRREIPEMDSYFKKGNKVYFDSWLAVKYPKNEEGDFYWLVKYQDIRAIEYAE